MLQLQLFDTYSYLFSSMEQQLHRGQIPLMLFKNITKKMDSRERILQTNHATFVTELRADIVENLKKLASSTTVVRIHPQNHPHFAYINSLQQISAPKYGTRDPHMIYKISCPYFLKVHAYYVLLVCWKTFISVARPDCTNFLV
jgi:hypothetical protein